MTWLKNSQNASDMQEASYENNVNAIDTNTRISSPTASPTVSTTEKGQTNKSKQKKKKTPVSPSENSDGRVVPPQDEPTHKTDKAKHMDTPTEATVTKIILDMSQVDKMFLEPKNTSIKRVSGMATAVSFTQRKTPLRKLRHNEYMSIAAQHLTYSMIYHVCDGSTVNIQDLDTSKHEFDSVNMQSFRILNTIVSNMHTKRAHIQAIELELVKACLAVQQDR